MIDHKKIAVVIPAYNEQKLIAKTINTIPEFVDRIYVVDDASQDKTIDRALGTDRKNLKIITHKKNTGVGGAIISGYHYCIKHNIDIVAVMGADNQMNPSDLKSLVKPLVNGTADYSKGDRLSYNGVFKLMPLSRFVGNHILSFFTRFASGYSQVRDSQCGYTAITRITLTKLSLNKIYTRYGFPNDLLAHLNIIDAKISQVVVEPIYGQEVSGISVWTAIAKVPLVLLRSYFYRVKNKRPIRRCQQLGDH